MLRYLAILFILIIPCWSWGATYYVSPAGDGSDGSTWAKAYTTIAAALSAHHSAGDVFEIDGGTPTSRITYNETLNANYGVALTFKGSEESGRDGRPIILTTTNGHCITMSGASTIQYVQLVNRYNSNARYSWNVVSGGASAVDVIFGEENPDRTTVPNRQLINVADGVTATATRCILQGAGTYRTVTSNAGSTLNLFDCIYRDNWGVGYIKGTLNSRNSVYAGNAKTTPVFDTTAATSVMSFTNDIFSGNNLNNKNYDIVNNTGGGTITYNHCDLLPHPINAASYSYDGVQTDCISETPKFKIKRRDSYFAVVLDDYVAGMSEFTSLVSIAESKGVHIGYAIHNIASISAGDWETIRGWVADGHEIVNHTMTHPNLTVTTGITITGPADSTYELTVSNSDDDPNNWTGTLLLKVSGSTVRTIDVSMSGDYSTPALVAADINGFGTGWSATVTTNTSGKSPMTAMTAATASAVGGVALDWDQSRYIYYEVGYAKSLIESNIGGGYVCKTLAYPYGGTDATIKGLVNNATTYPTGINKHLGARMIGFGSYTTTDDMVSGTGSLAGLQIFEIYGPHFVNIGGQSPTDATIVTNFGAFAEWLNTIGGVAISYSHRQATDGANYYSPTTIGKVLDELIAAGVTVTTPATILDRIRSSELWADSDSDGSRWTRTYTTDASNYHLRSSSPCKATGTYITGFHDTYTDFAGKAWKNPPSIGVYEYYPFGLSIFNGGSGGFGFHNFGFGF